MKDILITSLRDRTTTRDLFRQTTHQLAHMLAFEAIEFLPKKSINIVTPLAPTRGTTLAYEPVIVPILRSGLSLLPVFLEHFSMAAVGFVGLKRDEKTAQAHLYYFNVPPINHETYLIIVDPMIATGGSACSTVELLIQQGAREDHIIFVAVIGSQEGVTRLQKTFPHLHLIIAVIDDSLNAQKYIIPGLGDFGDRYFGTE